MFALAEFYFLVNFRKSYILLKNHMNDSNCDTESSLKSPFLRKGEKRYIRLYYFMPSKHLYDVLKNDEIKVSLPEECNDPLEFVSAAQTQGEETQKETRLNGGFISFSEKYDNSLMWSHYADSHRGVCLRFDFPIKMSAKINEGKQNHDEVTTPFASIADIEYPQQFTSTNPLKKKHEALLLKVVYSKIRPRMSNGVLYGCFGSSSHVDRIDMTPVLFTKATEWEYEKEWRLMITPAYAAEFHEDNFFVKGLTKYLTGIFLGKNYKERIATTCAKISQIKKHNNYLETAMGNGSTFDIDQAEFHEKEYKIILPRIENCL